MLSEPRDTIFAPATGNTAAAVTIIKVSGELTRDILTKLCAGLPPVRRAALRSFRGADGALIDRGLALWFPAPGSYTGEDCAELHIHGGRATLNATADALTTLGARPAEPGEFTRRAFLNGKRGLIEAEAIADLVASETEAQRRQAVRQMEGELGDIYHGWSGELRRQLAFAEALIDFGQDDAETLAGCDLAAVAGLLLEIKEHLADGQRGQRLRDGLVFAIVGPPNVGKSSLINRLAGRDVAIVADLPGTTRDVLEARVVFGDAPVTLLDTAGLRLTNNAIEAEGARRALERASGADLVIHLMDASGPEPSSEVASGELRIANKVDIAPTPSWASFGVSALTGLGMEVLRSALNTAALDLTRTSGPAPLTQIRHRAALSSVAEHLALVLRLGDRPELMAEELRSAQHALGRVTGHVSSEDILDEVFRRFCIGK